MPLKKDFDSFSCKWVDLDYVLWLMDQWIELIYLTTHEDGSSSHKWIHPKFIKNVLRLRKTS